MVIKSLMSMVSWLQVMKMMETSQMRDVMATGRYIPVHNYVNIAYM